MKGDDFIHLAGELLAKSRSPSEALRRTVLSRAYNGAYHVAVGFLVELGFPESSDHKVPANALAACGHADARRAGHILSELYTVRRKADYKLQDARFIGEIQDLHYLQDQVESALDVQTLLAACRTEPARSKIQLGIRSYRQKSAPERNQP